MKLSLKRILLKPLPTYRRQEPLSTHDVLQEALRHLSPNTVPHKVNKHLLIALVLAFVYHGVLLLSGDFKRTYDALIHVFFADHYYRYWWDPWEYRWYTGFPMTSYPPGSQQSIALVAHLFGGNLLNAFVVVQLFAVLNIVFGTYRSSKIWVSEEAAGYAALLVVFCSSITETVHVFGQLPTTFSLGFLLHALAYSHKWLDEGKKRYLFSAWAFNAATTAGHHVTTLFGAIFFVLPVVGLVIVQKFREPLADEPTQRPAHITRKNFRALVTRRVRRVLPVSMRAGVYLVGLVAVLIIVVLPYWLYSRSDPIVQVPIPHASRDNFLVDTSAGLVFWLVPYGLSILTFPYVFYKAYSTKAWPLALSYSMLVLLGTGGTTPLPHLILGNSFNILTLDRFTFWATIIQLPILGEFVVSILHGGLAKYLREQFGTMTWRGVQIGLLISYLAISVFVANLTLFRQFQPTAIDFQPIVNFLNKDQHSRWRYITLGFGDQMSLLSSETTATSVDGDYNSARQLPELNTSPIERLEGAKYAGIPGIGSLQQILGIPEKYNLKYVFSNDQFYDPLLFFSGWHRLQRLENGIMVWERADIPPLPAVLPRKDIPVYQSVMWGTVPMASIFAALLAISATLWVPLLQKLLNFLGIRRFIQRSKVHTRIIRLVNSLPLQMVHRLYHRVAEKIHNRLLYWSQLPPDDDDEQVLKAQRWQLYPNWIADIKKVKPAPPNAQHLRTAVMCLLLTSSLAYGIFSLLQQHNNPITIVQNYYDDLDFRRYSSAYDRLDPLTRPSMDQYLLQLSVINGLVASYGKLDSVYIHVVKSEPDHLQVRVNALWVTALLSYPTTDTLTMVKRQGQWYITPSSVDITLPPDRFLRQPVVEWHSQGRSVVTAGTTAFGDIQDRPLLQILSARLVKVGKTYSVVGELINTDVNPADVTVTAVLFDKYHTILSTYNAQTGMIHKLLPKETTPFRVDFEGVAGTGLIDATTLMGAFKPGLVTPLHLKAPIASFEVYAKAVVAQQDLDRGVGAQDVSVQYEADGKPHLVGTLYNSSTTEATVPHLLVTYYDKKNVVAWVDNYYIEQAVEPEHSEPFDIVLTPASAVDTIINTGNAYTNILKHQQPLYDPQLSWPERYSLPSQTGYSSMHLSMNYLIGVV